MSNIAHLGHVEIYTDRFDESLDFFIRVYGLKLSGQDATSACLRASDASGFKTHGWTSGDESHGPAFRFKDRFGHVFEIN